MNAMGSAKDMINAMTVDVEDYFHVSNFADVIRMEEWSKFESRVERNTLRLLEIFAEHHVFATCFILGWVAERHPTLVRAIREAGHEVACHGYAHKLVYQSTPQEFRADVRRAKKLLEDLSGTEVVGYRAPSFSIVKSCLWALDILSEEGFRYDSSIFPIWRQRYGIPDADRFPHRWITRNGVGLVQFPVSTFRVCGVNLPLGGGGYFRVLPYHLSRWAIGQLNRTEGRRAVMYIHSWEIDPAQPRVPAPVLGRCLHYVNLRSTESKLRRLLVDFHFGTLGCLLGEVDGRMNSYTET